MRNILIVLMLCALTLTTSSVFAAKYDETKRTERLGLSYYDGRPLYVVMFGFTGPDDAPVGYSMSYYRVFTGDNLSDFGTSSFQGEGRRATVTYGDTTVQERYFYSVIDADGMTVFSSNYAYSYPYRDWTLKLLERYPPPKYVSGDLAVTTYDNILPNAQDWARRGILLAVALLVISTGLNKFRELTSGGSKASINGEDKAGSGALAYDKLSRSDRKLFDAAVSGTLATGLSERLLSNDLRDAADFISGRAFGLEFDAKVQNGNRILLESFGRLSKEDQDALLEEYRNMSWGASYEESIEKRFLAFQGENFADEANPFNLNRESYGGRTGRYYVARGGVLEGFNYFEGEDDEEDGEPPF